MQDISQEPYLFFFRSHEYFVASAHAPIVKGASHVLINITSDTGIFLFVYVIAYINYIYVYDVY